MKIESVVFGINGIFVADYWMVFVFLFFLQTLPTIEWGRHIWAILDVGCGVASFGVYLLDKNVLTMSFAPKDEHEAEIQFDLEGGMLATLSVIGTWRLTFLDKAYDLIRCAHCEVHWDANGTLCNCFSLLSLEY